MRSLSSCLLALIALIGQLSLSPNLLAEEPVDFNRDIRPILSKHCLACHGQDEGDRDADYRLDTREGALSELSDDIYGIVPGDPDESEIMIRILEEDDFRMPPADHGERLSKHDIDLLTRWIKEGAPYSEHWSFVPPQKSELPEVSDKTWAINDIDHFILNQLDKHGLTPSEPADRYTLIRRLSFDLRGLPPTLEEIDLFVTDESPQAYEKLVDRFLADKKYGEKWARKWLDLARYADSAGYGSDPLRTIWRYRDWVIDAYNKNIPFDQFTIEQLAGDLLHEPTLEQKMATAFHRNTMTNTEGGTDDEEFRVEAIKDRVDTTMLVWMGLSMGCAKCHDHKYDPITQTEYYQFFAFFNQSADNDQPDEAPTIKAPSPEQSRLEAELNPQIAAVQAVINQPTPELQTAQEAWEQSFHQKLNWQTVLPSASRTESGATFEVQKDQSLFVTETDANNDVYHLTCQPQSSVVTAIQLETILDERTPSKRAGQEPNGGFLISGIKIRRAEDDTPLKIKAAFATHNEKGFTITDAVKSPDNPNKGWAIGPQEAKPQTAWIILDEPVTLTEGEKFELEILQKYSKPKYILRRFRISLTDDARANNYLSIPRDQLALIQKEKTERKPEESNKLAAYFRSITPLLEDERKKLSALKAKLPNISTLPVMQELPPEKQRKTWNLNKGNFLNKGEEVHAGSPQHFHEWENDSPKNRLGMAHWLVDHNNPLTARVTVNRIWAELFMSGIVTTEEDFGTQGDYPSHPKLLDWLAIDFMEQGWNRKALIKKIVMSQTYRQSSKVDPEKLDQDPVNKWLWRFPRKRLTAEMVRDQALSLSGLLSDKMHGPSVYPPQPKGLWRAAFNGQRTWATSTGEDRYRRGIYTYWRRTVPYPSMAAFDAPSREICTVRRSTTNTPLQVFVTLNDPVYVEAAQALGRRIVSEGGSSLESQIQYGLRLCTGRPATEEAIQQLVQLYESERTHFEQHPEEAQKLAIEPLGALPDHLKADQMAAWTVIANVLLNLDAVLTRS